MKSYKIIKLNSKDYDFLILSLTHKDIFEDIDKINREIKLENGKVIFDFLLINGTSKNRFISGIVANQKLLWDKYKIVKNVPLKIKAISLNFFKEHEQLVKNAVIPEIVKFKILNHQKF